MSSTTNKEIVKATCKALFANFDPVASKELLTEDYVQHNPGVPSGAAAILGFLPVLEKSNLKYTNVRMIAQGDLVACHGYYENAEAFGAKKMAAFDVFRVDADGKVSEHWDNLQAIPDSTVSGRSMVDGPVEIVDLDKTDANKKIAEGLLTDCLIGGAGDKLSQYISSEQYDQHNPMIGDTLEGIMKALGQFAEMGKNIVYDKICLSVAEGNFVMTGCEGKFGEDPTAFYDLFRLENGKIVEHWDVIAPIPAEFAHDNGKF